MLWNGSYPLLELHLDRLADSADYFDFACDRAEIRAALEQHAQQFARPTPQKVRLLLIDADGNFGINSEPLLRSATRNRIGRVRISPRRTDPADPMLYHKTTQRPLYALGVFAGRSATASTTCSSSTCAAKSPRAPSAMSSSRKTAAGSRRPIECGLLAGVYRRHLLETRPDIEERMLTLDDLRTADAVYITNAVRGLRRVRSTGDRRSDSLDRHAQGTRSLRSIAYVFALF